MLDTCQTCGRPTDSHNRHVRFTWPDPVHEALGDVPSDEVWMSHEDAATSVMMQVPEYGPFVRALLPVSLTGGFTVTFGVWLAVHPDDLQKAFREWWSPEYPSLELEGLLANAVPPWGLVGAPVHAVVRDPEHTPYCNTSASEEVSAVLLNEWPHDTVLDAIGST